MNISKHKIINTFDKINKSYNSLYIIDLDDTLFYYPNLGKKWWNESYKQKLEQYRCEKYSNLKTLEEWEIKIVNSIPNHIDINGFNNLIDHCNNTDSNIIFLTARNERTIDITYNHVKELYPNNNYDIYFANGNYKGNKIDEILNNYNNNYKIYDNIHFIDDCIFNCNDVKDKHPHINVYQFIFD